MPLKEPVLRIRLCFLLDLDPNPCLSRTELLDSACFLLRSTWFWMTAALWA